MTETPFDTFIKSGFENGANAFKANFADGLELGAQFCAYQSGALLLDLKGGWTDRQKQNPVDENSLFSVCLLYTSPSPRDATLSRMPSSA